MNKHEFIKLTSDVTGLKDIYVPINQVKAIITGTGITGWVNAKNEILTQIFYGGGNTLVKETPKQIFELINNQANKKGTKMKTNYENAMSTKEEYEAIKKELEIAKAKMNEFKKKAKSELEWILNEDNDNADNNETKNKGEAPMK